MIDLKTLKGSTFFIQIQEVEGYRGASADDLLHLYDLLVEHGFGWRAPTRRTEILHYNPISLYIEDDQKFVCMSLLYISQVPIYTIWDFIPVSTEQLNKEIEIW